MHGKRPGPGRPIVLPTPAKRRVVVLLTDEQAAWLIARGASKTVRRLIDEEIARNS